MFIVRANRLSIFSSLFLNVSDSTTVKSLERSDLHSSLVCAANRRLSRIERCSFHSSPQMNRLSVHQCEVWPMRWVRKPIISSEKSSNGYKSWDFRLNQIKLHSCITQIRIIWIHDYYSTLSALVVESEMRSVVGDGSDGGRRRDSNEMVGIAQTERATAANRSFIHPHSVFVA